MIRGRFGRVCVRKGTVQKTAADGRLPGGQDCSGDKMFRKNKRNRKSKANRLLQQTGDHWVGQSALSNDEDKVKN